MDWKNRAKAIIKSELAKQNVDYIELTARLNSIGIKESQANLANKINRGTFSFVFALQVFEILEIESLNLK